MGDEVKGDYASLCNQAIEPKDKYNFGMFLVFFCGYSIDLDMWCMFQPLWLLIDSLISWKPEENIQNALLDGIKIKLLISSSIFRIHDEFLESTKW